MTGFQEFQQPTHAYNPWIGAKPDHNMESASEREWKRLEAKGVVDKFRRLIPKPKPGEGVTHKHQYPLGEGRKWPHAHPRLSTMGRSAARPAADARSSPVADARSPPRRGRGPPARRQHDCPYDNGQPGPVVASSLERRE